MNGWETAAAVAVIGGLALVVSTVLVLVGVAGTAHDMIVLGVAAVAVLGWLALDARLGSRPEPDR